MSEKESNQKDWLETELEEASQGQTGEETGSQTDTAAAEKGAEQEKSGRKSPFSTISGLFRKDKTKTSSRRSGTTSARKAREEAPEEDPRELVNPSSNRQRIWMILGLILLVVIVVVFLLSDRIFNSVQGKASYVLTETDKTVTYIEGNTGVEMRSGKLLRCSQDGLQALNENGSVAWDIPFTMSSPYLVTAGDYISVADRLGMALLLINNGKIVTEITTESQLLLNTVNEQGMSAAVLDASAGHLVNLYSIDGATLMQRRTYSTTDGIPMAVALSADSSRMATLYVNYTGAVMTSILTVFDLTETGSALVDRIVGSVSFEDTLVSDIRFVGSQCFYVGTDRFGAVSTGTEVKTVWETQISYAIESLAMADNFFAVRYGEGLAGTPLPPDYNIMVYNYNGDVLSRKNVENVNYLDAWGDTVVYGAGRSYAAMSSTGKPKWTLQSYEEYSRLVQYDSDKTVAALRSGVIRLYKVTLKGAGDDGN